jgi:hypothetical protein
MLTTWRGCCAFESTWALPSGVIRGCETTSIQPAECRLAADTLKTGERVMADERLAVLRFS